MLPTLDGCHPLVARAKQLFDGFARDERKREALTRRPKRSNSPTLIEWTTSAKLAGRFASEGEGALRIVASLANIDWILRFDDALVRGLITAGCSIEARTELRSHWVEVGHAGETVTLSFAEEYDKDVPAEKLRPGSLDAALHITRWVYTPRNSYKLKVVRQIGNERQWVGNALDLEEKLPTVVLAAVLAIALAVWGTSVSVQQMTVATFQAAAQQPATTVPAQAPNIIINVPSSASPPAAPTAR